MKLFSPLKTQERIDLIMDYSVPVIGRPYFVFKYLTNFNFLQPRYWHPLAIPYHQGKLQPMNKSFASYQVEVEIPSGITAVTSGESVSEKRMRRGYKKVISAASHVTNFGLMFFEDIQKEEREVEGIKIKNYFSENKAPWTKEYVDHAVNVLEFYLKEVGFYPQKVINIIPGATEKWGGGFPIASNIFAMHFSEGINSMYIRNIAAHEIAHTYWGYDYVLVPREYGYWLGIALGMYTDGLFRSVRRRPYRWGYMLHQLLGYNTTLMQSNKEFSKYNIDLNNVLAHRLEIIKIQREMFSAELYHFKDRIIYIWKVLFSPEGQYTPLRNRYNLPLYLILILIGTFFMIKDEAIRLINRELRRKQEEFGIHAPGSSESE